MSPLSAIVHLFWKAFNAFKKVGEIIVYIEYSDFADIFSYDFATKLPEHTSINDHPINLIES